MSATRIPQITRNAPAYAALGFWRGFWMIALTFVIWIATIVAWNLLDRAGVLPAWAALGSELTDEHARYPAGAGTEADASSLNEAVRGFALSIILNSVVLVGVFALVLRMFAQGGPARWLGPGCAFLKHSALSMVVVAPFIGLALMLSGPLSATWAWIAGAPLWAIVLFLTLPLQTPIEEIIFRGFIQRWLTGLVGDEMLAALAQSALFGLCHPGSFIPIFGLGLAASAARGMTGTLGAAWVVHLANNLVVTLLMFRPEIGGAIVPGYEVNARLLGLPAGMLVAAPLLLFLGLRGRAEAPLKRATAGAGTIPAVARASVWARSGDQDRTSFS